jgi:hypothetical protein
VAQTKRGKQRGIRVIVVPVAKRLSEENVLTPTGSYGGVRESSSTAHAYTHAAGIDGGSGATCYASGMVIDHDDRFLA